MDALVTLVLLGLLLAAPCFVQLVLWTAYGMLRIAVRYSPLTMPSTIFLASAKSIMVLSLKNSSFSTPA